MSIKNVFFPRLTKKRQVEVTTVKTVESYDARAYKLMYLPPISIILVSIFLLYIGEYTYGGYGFAAGIGGFIIARIWNWLWSLWLFRFAFRAGIVFGLIRLAEFVSATPILPF